MDRNQPTIESVNKKSVMERMREGRAAGYLTFVMGVAALAGCATEGAGAQPPKHETTQSETTTPSPDKEATPSPQETETTEAHVFSGTINYEALTDPKWAELNEIEQQARCSEFFAANIENEPVMTAQSTGVEVASWYKNRLLVLEDLSLDTNDERNYQASLNIADCLTLSYITTDEVGPGREALRGQVTHLNQWNGGDAKMIYIEPDQVTRYSDGTFPATAKNDLSYAALSIEGRENNGIGKQPGELVMNYFQWSPDENVYRFVLTTPTENQGINPYFGDLKPPVVLDPMRQNAPNTLDHFEG